MAKRLALKSIMTEAEERRTRALNELSRWGSYLKHNRAFKALCHPERESLGGYSCSLGFLNQFGSNIFNVVHFTSLLDEELNQTRRVWALMPGLPQFVCALYFGDERKPERLAFGLGIPVEEFYLLVDDAIAFYEKYMDTDFSVFD